MRALTYRHSRESGNPHPALSIRRNDGGWAGMVVWLGGDDYRVGDVIQRWLPDSVGAHGRAPLPGIAKLALPPNKKPPFRKRGVGGINPRRLPQDKVGVIQRFSLTQPSPAGRGLGPGGAIRQSAISGFVDRPGAGGRRPFPPHPIIPAPAGIQNPGISGVSIGRGVDSRFRGNDGGAASIPAPTRHSRAGQNPELRQFRRVDGAGCGFPLSRE